ncbi:hypothetical protein DF186_24575, partial [Enterococcus hirae]
GARPRTARTVKGDRPIRRDTANNLEEPTMTTTLTNGRSTPEKAPDVDRPIPVTRRRIDRVLIGLGVAVAAVLVVAGGL